MSFFVRYRFVRCETNTLRRRYAYGRPCNTPETANHSQNTRAAQTIQPQFSYLFNGIMLKYILLAFIAFSVSAHAQTLLDPHEISQAEASKLVGAFQTATSAWNVHAGTLPKASIVWLLNRKGAASLRYYWGLNEKNELQAIYVAATADGDDILDTDAILCPRRLTLHSEMSAANILTVAQAVEMMKRYRKSPLFAVYKKHVSSSMPRQSILRLADIKSNEGIRSYFGMTATGTPTLVFVGTTATALDNPVLLEDRGDPNCPPDCKVPPPTLIKLSSEN